jgi:Na+/H+ antiporter NhaC
MAPVAVVVAGVLIGMWLDGRAKLVDEQPGARPDFFAAFAAGSSYRALLWASLLGCLTAIGLAVGQRILSLGEAMEAWLVGLRAMILAILILVLAWCLGAVCKDLQTADWLFGVVGDWLPVSLLPATVFVMAALVSFATGSSWGTMGILFTLVIPLAYRMGGGDELVMLGTISSVLTGAVWGDHCSPVSDTTILSSMASSCDHVDHVRTQLPYALVVGGVSLVAGDLACGLGLYPAWVGLLLGAGLVVGLVYLLGTPLADETEP